MFKPIAAFLAIVITGFIFYKANQEPPCEPRYTQEDMEQTLEYYKVLCYRLQFTDEYCQNLLDTQVLYMQKANDKACPADTE